MTSTPFLGMPTDDDDYTIDTDASDFAIGAVLSQKQDGVERVIAYASRALDKREKNYCVTRRELLAIVHFLKYFKQYLLGKHFKIRTDHAALTWLRKTPDPIGQQARWLEQMEEFDFTVEHRPGLSHGNAGNGMSRRPCPKIDCYCSKEQENTVSNSGGPADHKFLIELTSGNTDIDENDDDCIPICSESDIASENIVFNRSVQSDVGNKSTNEQHKETEDVYMSWSWDDLKIAQQNDKEIGGIVRWFTENEKKPSWDQVAMKSVNTKALWHMWPRLSIIN